MIVLVDYNNLLENDRRKGVNFVVDRIVSALDPAHLKPYRRVAFRLYDGWYEGQTPTRNAQAISAEVQKDFPATRKFSDTSGQYSLIVNVELAYSLRCDPGAHIWHTYRPQTNSNHKLNCSQPFDAGCSITPCVLSGLPDLVSSGQCPASGCPVTFDSLITRAGQKMVDSMIMSDMFFCHLNSLAEIAIVTSDDDLWPTIRMLLIRGMKIFHVQTHPARTIRRMYTQGIGSNYVQLSL